MTLAKQAEGLVERFGKTLAVDGVDLAVQPGTVLGLLGPNRPVPEPAHRPVGPAGGAPVPPVG